MKKETTQIQTKQEKKESRSVVKSRCRQPIHRLLTTMEASSIITFSVWCMLIMSITSFQSRQSTYRPRAFFLRSFLRMDDEVARPNIKEELTTRDEYLDTQFKRLSSSGHDLTPIDTIDWIMLILSGANLDFLGVSNLNPLLITLELLIQSSILNYITLRTSHTLYQYR